MATTNRYPAPEFTQPAAQTESGEPVRFSEAVQRYLDGLEDVSERVAASVDPNTATVADVVNALKAAKLMKG